MKHLLLFFFIGFTISMQAQVVNTEKLRSKPSQKQWLFDLNVNLGLSRNKAGQTFRIGSRARVEYFQTKNKWLIFGGYALTQFTNVDDPDAVPTNFTNNGFGHLRYNYHVNSFLTWEAFSQAQYDEIQEVKIRVLNGTGPRFQLLKTDSSHLYIGALYMYEYEETTDLENLTFNKDHRLSTYISGAIQVKDYLTVNHITYYQPNLSNINDYRISSETNVSVKLTTKLSLTAYFQLIYDDLPPISVPNTMFSLTNGITLAF